MMAAKKKDAKYWRRVEHLAKLIKSDACSSITQIFKSCCYEHDIFYRTHSTILTNRSITKEEADLQFKLCMQSRSPVGKASPVAHARYWALTSRFSPFRGTAQRAWDCGWIPELE